MLRSPHLTRFLILTRIFRQVRHNSSSKLFISKLHSNLSTRDFENSKSEILEFWGVACRNIINPG